METTNAALVMASIALLPPADKAELLNQLKEWQDKMLVDGVQAIAAGAPNQTVDRRVDKYVQLRDARAANTKAYEAVDKAFKDCLSAIDASFLADANAQGVKGFKTDKGTVYTEERMQASIADEAVFFDFVRESGDLDFFERRLKVGHLREYAEANDGQMPPGLNIFRELSVKVRRS